MSESEKLQTSTVDLAKRLVARYDYYYDTRTFSYNLRKTSKPKKTKPRSVKHALIVRRLIDERGRYSGTVIDIKSGALRDVLAEVNEHVEGIDLSRNEPEVSEELMYYSYPGLKARLEAEEKAESRDERLIADIMAAVLVIEADQAKLLRDFVELTVLNEITFDIIWALFRPNTLVLNRHELTDEYRILLARRAGYGQHEDRTRYLKVVCDIIHDDGELFGYTRVVLAVNEFRGVKKITDLDVYPLEYCPVKDDLYKSSTELGKKFAKMPKHAYYEMTGQAMRERSVQERYSYWHRRQSENQTPEKFYTSGRVMISPSAFSRFQSGSQYNPSVHRSISRESLTEEQYAICTPILLGFAFDRKSWGAFPMSRLREVTWNDDAFRVLVLGEKQKTLIHGLVRQHASQFGSGFDDIIKGKGRGLIGLLAGTPGCGKTLTAEAVAEVTRRPLYAVSAGELGTTPKEVESRLLSVLELAQMWDAVLLLDEAEVFLQQRNTTDVNRNALVSIFLRQLEYYQGILILTTNMAEQCDRAFESRIHFSVYYPELDATARKSIWTTFFRNASLEVTKVELDDLAQHVINGRQIKNAFSSAQTIALSQGLTHLTIDHIKVVLEVLYDWQAATRK